MAAGPEIRPVRYPVMSMTQLIIGAALGFILAEGALYGTRNLIIWVRRDGTLSRLRALSVSRESAWIAGFTKYGALVGGCAAVITLGAWAVGDYLAAKSARTAALANAVSMPEPTPAPGAAGQSAKVATSSSRDAPEVVVASGVDPYADPEFKVQHRSHRAGRAVSLKETLVEREEAKARTELVQETKLHVRRSQYDCEAAERAGRYLKAGLDVWGFASWQLKYFPAESYKGATLPQCKDIKDVVDPSQVDLQSTVAQASHS
jgi:hypothetical protein